MNEILAVLYYACSGLGLLVIAMFVNLFFAGRQHSKMSDVLSVKSASAVFALIVVLSLLMSTLMDLPVASIAKVVSLAIPAFWILGFQACGSYLKPTIERYSRRLDCEEGFWTAVMTWGQLSHVRFFVLDQHDAVLEVHDPILWKRWYELRVARGKHLIEETKLEASGYDLTTVFAGTTDETSDPPCPFTTRVWGRDSKGKAFVAGCLSEDLASAKHTHEALKNQLVGRTQDEVKIYTDGLSAYFRDRDSTMKLARDLDVAVDLLSPAPPPSALDAARVIPGPDTEKGVSLTQLSRDLELLRMKDFGQRQGDRS